MRNTLPYVENGEETLARPLGPIRDTDGFNNVQVGAGAADPVIPSTVSTGPQVQNRFISP